MRAIGGHVKKLVISGTGEVVLITLPPTRLMRRYSPETGLNLLSKN
jgi:predicted DNA-binding protein with PD1-like motif